jgi:hypothetical protein
MNKSQVTIDQENTIIQYSVGLLFREADIKDPHVIVISILERH